MNLNEQRTVRILEKVASLRVALGIGRARARRNARIGSALGSFLGSPGNAIGAAIGAGKGRRGAAALRALLGGTAGNVVGVAPGALMMRSGLRTLEQQRSVDDLIRGAFKTFILGPPTAVGGFAAGGGIGSHLALRGLR